MKNQELVHVSDCTLLAAEDHYELSFREKIELCRLIDKLGVSAIDLCPIRQKKTDRLLIKSICSAVKNAVIAVPVDITDEESIRITWEALKEAAKPRLQIAVPVSSVQMEYLLHMKPDAMIRKVAQAVRECRELTDEVELIVFAAASMSFHVSSLPISSSRNSNADDEKQYLPLSKSP